jgi:hypothetical protein
MGIVYEKNICDKELGYSQSEKFEIPNNFKIIYGCLEETADPEAKDEILD